MQIGVRELKSDLSHILARAQAGETFEVTSHRLPIARIVGVPSPQAEGLARLLADGVVSWTGDKPKFSPPLELTGTGMAVSRMVMEDRG